MHACAYSDWTLTHRLNRQIKIWNFTFCNYKKDLFKHGKIANSFKKENIDPRFHSTQADKHIPYLVFSGKRKSSSSFFSHQSSDQNFSVFCSNNQVTKKTISPFCNKNPCIGINNSHWLIRCLLRRTHSRGFHSLSIEHPACILDDSFLHPKKIKKVKKIKKCGEKFRKKTSVLILRTRCIWAWFAKSYTSLALSISINTLREKKTHQAYVVAVCTRQCRFA